VVGRILCRERNQSAHACSTVSVDGCTYVPEATLALDFRQRCAGFVLGSVATAELFSLPVNDAGVDGQLVTHDRLAAGAACSFDASDLWRQLAALSHLREVSRCSFGMGCDEADLCQLAGGTEPIDR